MGQLQKIAFWISIVLTAAVLLMQDALLSGMPFPTHPALISLAIIALIWIVAFEIEPLINFVRTFPPKY